MMLRKTTLMALASAAAIALPVAGAQAQLGVQLPSTSSVTQPVQGTTDIVQDTANQAADTAQDAARDASDSAQDAADSAADAAQDAANSTTDSAQAAADNAADSAQDAADAAAEAADAAASADASASAGAQAGATQVATAADVKAGARVLDPQGGEVGTIESVDANGAVVATGAARVQIPIASFAKNDAGLVISLTKAQLEAQARAAS